MGVSFLSDSSMYSRDSLWGNSMLSITLFALLSTITHIWAQGSSSDYKRANNLKEQFRNQIFQLEITPNWSADNQHFWYLKQLASDRYQFVKVSIQSQSKGLAFNHKKLATKLTNATGQSIEPDRLPITNLVFTDRPDIWRFNFQGKLWELDTKTDNLRIANIVDITPIKLGSTIRPSYQTGVEISVTFRNETNRPIHLFWLDGQGDQKLYSTLEIGEVHQQHTYTGHIWLIIDEIGQKFGVYEASLQEPLVTIQEERLHEKKQSEKITKKDLPSNGVFSPDGTKLAFIKEHNLWIRKDNGQVQQLSQDGNKVEAYDQTRIHWAPNSQKLISFKVQQAQEHLVHLIESSPSDQIQPKLHSFQYLKPGDKIAKPHPCVFNIEKGQQLQIESRLFPNPWSLSHVRWHQDSTTCYFLYNQRGHQVLRLIAVDSDTGQTDAVFNELSPSFIDYSQKMYLNWLNDNELIWMSERSGWNHLYLYDVTNRRLKHQITTGKWAVRKVEHVDKNTRQIWFQANGDAFTEDKNLPTTSDPYYVHYGRIDLSGENLVWLTKDDGTHQVQWSPNRCFFVDSWSRVDQPFIHQLRCSENGNLILDLEKSDWTKLRNLGWSVPQRFSSLGRDGKTNIYGLLWRPTNFDKQKRYPVVEHIYAGPHDAFVPKKFQVHYHQQEMAELGFIVVQIDGMGTNWRSKHFHNYCWQNLKDAGFPDRISWIRSAASEYPEIDLTRIGVYGGSAGGQNTLSGMLHYGDFYHVGVADCGCHDNRMDKIWWNEAWMGWPIGSQYDDNSNVTHAKKLTGKLLLIVGELDRNVDPASTMQVVNALIQADKDFDLLIIPGVGHGAAGSTYGTRRQRDFFVRHLLDREPRVDSTEKISKNDEIN